MNGRKLCGILTEIALEGETGRAESLVIGAGVNVSHTPEDFGPEVSRMATSLVQEGFPVSRAALAAAMAEELFVLADALGGDVTAWVEEYRRQCVNLGKPVRLLWTEGRTRGRRSTLRYTPRPAGDWKVRPTRPRPAVWAEAAATVRSGAPRRASRLR